MDLGISIYSVLMIVFGLLGVFKGYKVFRLYLTISAFILGFYIGFKIFSGLEAQLHIVLSVILGIVLGLISYGVYKLGIFLIFFGITAEVSKGLIIYLGLDLGTYKDLVIIVFSLIVGLLLLIFKVEKMILVFATASVGAAYTIFGVLSLKNAALSMADANVFEDLSKIFWAEPLFLIGFIALTAIGIFFQFKTDLK